MNNVRVVRRIQRGRDLNADVEHFVKIQTVAGEMLVLGTDDVMIPAGLFFEAAPAVLFWREDEAQPTACVITRRGAFQVQLYGAAPQLRQAIVGGRYTALWSWVGCCVSAALPHNPPGPQSPGHEGLDRSLRQFV